MSLKENVLQAMARETGEPVKRLTEIMRHCNIEGLVTKHTRSLASQVFTNRDLANLTAAVMRGGAVANCIEAPADLALATCDNLDPHIEMQTAGFAKHGRLLSVFQQEGHSFMDGLASLYGVARLDPERFRDDFADTRIVIEQRALTGQIELVFRDFDTLDGIDLPYSYYGPRQVEGELQVRAIISAATIAGVAEAAGMNP